jgi:hypothetical protein
VTDPLRGKDPTGDIEALLRSTAGLPRVSSDLRPRVIEAAIASRERRRHRRRAAVIAAVALCLVAVPPPTERDPDGVRVGQRAEQPSDPPSPAENGDPLLATSADGWPALEAGGEWELVDRFKRLRAHQLRVLRQAF